MLISEKHVEIQNANQDDEHRYGMGWDDTPYESFTDNIKRLFQALQRDYGRCVSKVYMDNPDGKTIAIGWVFQKQEKYTDCNRYYTHETWIILHDEMPTKSTTYHYHELK